MALIRDLTDVQLAAQWQNWNNKITNATNWGASLTAANEFRRECEREINERGIIVIGYNDKETKNEKV
jgi:hypothetical protein